MISCPCSSYNLHQPLLLEPFLRYLVTFKFNGLDLAHEVTMVVAVGIIESEDAPVVPRIDGRWRG